MHDLRIRQSLRMRNRYQLTDQQKEGEMAANPTPLTPIPGHGVTRGHGLPIQYGQTSAGLLILNVAGTSVGIRILAAQGQPEHATQQLPSHARLANTSTSPTQVLVSLSLSFHFSAPSLLSLHFVYRTGECCYSC